MNTRRRYERRCVPVREEHDVLVAGAGIGGLTAALCLHAAGVPVSLVEASALPLPAGTGVTLLPAAVAELTALGLGEHLAALGVAPAVLVHYDRHGSPLWSQPRGLALGHPVPQYGIHRAALQDLLLRAVHERLGPHALRTATSVVRFDEADDHTVRITLRDGVRGRDHTERARALVGADGLRSAVRAALHRGEGPPRWDGTWLWRGLVPWRPVLGGRTVALAGGGDARLLVQPVSRTAEMGGLALLHWSATVRFPPGRPGTVGVADWNRKGRLADLLPHYTGWRLGDLDVPALLASTPQIHASPVVRRPPLRHWGQGAASLLGDAAHPFLPAALDGTSQAVLDAAVLARCLARTTPDRAMGLRLYEHHRLPRALALHPPGPLPADTLFDLVTARAPDGFDHVEDVLTPAELGDFARTHQELEAAAGAW
ncbi:FAD-dependent monooxygenase [Streptomyces sp. NPDC049954]|uniref:FAD-dependent monooxygenase n=1 Tax=Streptomyces sp. NPDC049954 TaxID=3155779 RepID=UPI003443E880